jgi:uncharacterized protein YndB with AHSA1/START domain
MRRVQFLLIPALVALVAGAVRAEVVDSQPNGFEVRQSADIAAPPAKVWEALGKIGAWWNSKHTFSGDAKNLAVDLQVGKCFCEALPDGGGVVHLAVIYVSPMKAVRFTGALGPLQGLGATGHLGWTLTANGTGTRFVQTYDVGGYAKGGFATWAAPVDSVLTEQVARLKAYVETGKPD